jgi:pyruvate formate lyase activating enzyme
LKFLNKKISRRDFIKYSLIGLASIGIGGYVINSLMKKTIYGEVTNDAPKEIWKWSKEAYYYSPLGENIKCELCPNGCILGKDDRSKCRVKVNKNGKLYTLAYGNPCSMNIDPIEKSLCFIFFQVRLLFLLQQQDVISDA